MEKSHLSITITWYTLVAMAANKSKWLLLFKEAKTFDKFQRVTLLLYRLKLRGCTNKQQTTFQNQYRNKHVPS